jgi:hypothetical protein
MVVKGKHRFPARIYPQISYRHTGVILAPHHCRTDYDPPHRQSSSSSSRCVCLNPFPNIDIGKYRSAQWGIRIVATGACSGGG